MDGPINRVASLYLSSKITPSEYFQKHGIPRDFPYGPPQRRSPIKRAGVTTMKVGNTRKGTLWVPVKDLQRIGSTHGILKSEEEMEELMEWIREGNWTGGLRERMIVAVEQDGPRIFNGHHRLEALSRLGWKWAPVVIDYRAGLDGEPNTWRPSSVKFLSQGATPW